MRISISCLLVLLLAGCETPLEQLHSLNPDADDFASALAAEYMAYSDSESEQGRKDVAEYFAAKGLKASKDETVEPETPLPTLRKSKQKELLNARKELLSVLSDDMKRVSAQKTARVQVLFDCWVHQQNTHIGSVKAPCAEEFSTTLADLQEVAESFKHANVTSYVVQFAENSPALNEGALATVDQIAAAISGVKRYRVELEGIAGKDKAAQELLSERLDNLRSALVAKQVTKGRIKLKRDNNSRVVILSNDVLQDMNQVDIMLKVFGVNGEKTQ